MIAFVKGRIDEITEENVVRRDRIQCKDLHADSGASSRFGRRD